jgi:hypothetical protein
VNLLKILAKYEIKVSKNNNSWNGKFSFLSLSILSLHAEFLKIDKKIEIIAWWMAFVEINSQHPVDLKFFRSSIQKISQIFSINAEEPKETKRERKISKEEEFFDKEIFKGKFLASCQELSQNFYKSIAKIHNEEDFTDMIENILFIENKIEQIRSESESDLKFNESVKNAILRGADNHLQIKIDSIFFETLQDENLLTELLKILEFTIEHWKKITVTYSEVFEK